MEFTAGGDGADAETKVATTPNPAGSALPGFGGKLYDAIKTKQATIGVVGLGYVGLPLSVEFAQKGFRTVGFDLSAEKVLRLNAGQNYIQDVANEDLASVVANGRFTARDTFEGAGDVDVFFICVPTPVTEYKDPDVSYIKSAAEAIAAHLRPGQLVILKSTTYPDTTEGLVQPILEKAASGQNMQLGRDYFLAFSPERIDPGNAQFNTSNTPVVVGGVTEACTALACLAMQQVVERVHRVSSPKVAEMEKLLENIFRSVNIALINELARLCDRMGGISIWEVVEAAATKPFGFMPFYPGPGLGGHCIPIDPYYLSWLARRYDFETSFITLSAHVNEEMPHYVVDAILRAIANRPVKVRDAKVLVLGVAFKKDVDDLRHSPALKVMELLRARGITNLSYSDPHVPTLRLEGENDPEPMQSAPLTREMLQSSDVVVILTDHSAFPYAQIARDAPCIIDTRNALKHVAHDRDKIVLLGSGRFDG
ncbi:MAG TPA: nucleotide sugar dehydrogenase [Rhodothermales bacterium]|nr:nucleotide sugar dehydrogenase [Rhodothermales bacterium]